MLVSLSIIEHQTVQLGNYKIPYVSQNELTKPAKRPYQIQIINKKPYYFFPYGGALLSVPYVALAKGIFHISAATEDGRYQAKAEKQLLGFFAALLMGTLGVLFYRSARLVLNKAISFAIGCIGALGTQVWSMASRLVESQTWMVLLLAITIYHLFGSKLERFRINGLFLGTVLSWMYFVRPTAAIDIVLITTFIALKFRKALLPLVLTGLVWFCLFLFFSYEVFGKAFPNYYQASRLLSYPIPEFFLAHLISPSRGLFIFLPWTIFLAYLIFKNFHSIAHKDFLILSLTAIALHLILVSSFSQWWGGHSFGPRLLTDIVPWLIVCLILAIDAWQKLRIKKQLSFQIEVCIGIVLIAASLFINGYGAISVNALRWNVVPDNIDDDPSRVWDWDNPQFWPRDYKKEMESLEGSLKISTEWR